LLDAKEVRGSNPLAPTSGAKCELTRDAGPYEAAAVMQNLGPPTPWHLKHELKRCSRE
jgi:hypothetical protein